MPPSSHLIRAVLTVVSLAVTHASLAQQADVTSVQVDGPIDTQLTASRIDELDKLFVSGDIASARHTLTEIVHAARDHTTKKDLYADGRNVLVAVWPGSDAGGDIVLRRLILPEPSAHPFSLDLPGLKPGVTPPQLYELLISADPRSRLVSQYTFTREANPVLQALPDVASRLAGPLFSLVGAGSVSVARRGGTDRVQHVYVVASRIAVPFQRAKGRVKSSAQVPVSVEAFREGLQRFTARTRFKEAPRSEWARAYIDRLQRAASKAAESHACTAEFAVMEQCLAEFDTTFIAAYSDCLAHCAAGRDPGADDLAALQAIDDKFRDFVAKGGPDQLTAESEFRNRPLTHFTFGLGTAVVLVGSANKERAKLNDAGNLTADPLGRQISMILLNWSPSGYDEDAMVVNPSERARIFAGGILTPDIGVSAGVSILIVRGLALNAGGGLLFVRGLRKEDTFGNVPTSASDPFALGVAKIAFAGISLNFK